MKRNDQIQEAAWEIANHPESFIAGAKWADEHPKYALEEAIELLKDIRERLDWIGTATTCQHLIDDFLTGYPPVGEKK
jgi:hypothetical protein